MGMRYYHWGQDSLTNYSVSSVTLSYLQFLECHTSFSYLGRNCFLFQKLFNSPASLPIFSFFAPLWLTPPVSAHTIPPHASIKFRLSICLAPLEAESLLRCSTQFLSIIISLVPIIVSKILKAFGECWMAEWKKSHQLTWQSNVHFIITHVKPLQSRLCGSFFLKLSCLKVKWNPCRYLLTFQVIWHRQYCQELFASCTQRDD